MSALFNNIDFYCVDTFEGHNKKDLIGNNHDVHLPTWFSDTTYEHVKSHLDVFDFIQVAKDRTQDCKDIFEGKRIHFEQLDVGLYQPILFSLNLFSAKLQHGGILLVDDFGFVTITGVRKAVNQFMKENTNPFFKIELSTG